MLLSFFKLNNFCLKSNYLICKKSSWKRITQFLITNYQNWNDRHVSIFYSIQNQSNFIKFWIYKLLPSEPPNGVTSLMYAHLTVNDIILIDLTLYLSNIVSWSGKLGSCIFLRGLAPWGTGRRSGCPTCCPPVTCSTSPRCCSAPVRRCCKGGWTRGRSWGWRVGSKIWKVQNHFN